MKKTIPTSIARTLFYVEEDAYKKLDSYLTEVRQYFASYGDNKEIIEDIESRIQEQLLEMSTKDKTERIITESHVDMLITSMGRPQEFEGAEKEHEQSEPVKANYTGRKKLYRDKENALIAGVASGLAQYFGIDPIIVRSVFFITIFFGGFGVIAYIFLWFAVPEAKTATEKLEMEGSPVTLGEVKKMVEEKIDEVRGSKDSLKKSSEEFRSFIVTITSGFFSVFGKVIGMILKIIAFCGTVALVTMLIITITNTPFSTIATGISTLGIYAGIGIVFIIAIIPFLFIGLAGNILSNRSRSYKTLAGVLALIWIVAGIAGTTIAFHVVKNRQQYLPVLSGGRETTLSPAIADFTSVVVKNGQRVTIENGTTTSIQIKGTLRDVNRVTVENVNGILTIGKKFEMDGCFFCGFRQPEIVLTTPSLVSLGAENASKVTLTGSFTNLSLLLENASSVTLSGNAQTVSATLRNASSLYAPGFTISALDITLENASRGAIKSDGTISGVLRNGSHLSQHGTASTENIKLENGLKVWKE